MTLVYNDLPTLLARGTKFKWKKVDFHLNKFLHNLSYTTYFISIHDVLTTYPGKQVKIQKFENIYFGIYEFLHNTCIVIHFIWMYNGLPTQLTEGVEIPKLKNIFLHHSELLHNMCKAAKITCTHGNFLPYFQHRRNNENRVPNKGKTNF